MAEKSHLYASVYNEILGQESSMLRKTKTRNIANSNSFVHCSLGLWKERFVTGMLNA